MPKKDMDWSKLVVYKICCKDLNISDIYIGSTCNLVQRRYCHKTTCNNIKSKGYNTKIYQFIRENGGWNNWSVIEIDKCPCLDFEEAAKIERYYIETLNATLNINIPLRTRVERKIHNYDKIKEVNKKYYENNKETIQQYKKEYSVNNKDKIKEYQIEWYKNNMKNIYEKNKEKILCECGNYITINNLNRHKTTQKHFKLIEQFNNSVSS